jgi:signal recognition particle GTPase
LALSAQTLNDLKKYFDELKNSQNPVATRPQEVLAFKEKAINYLLASLSKSQQSSKDKITVLEILERDLISSKYNVALFNKLYTYLIEEDENVAIQASKAIDALIKQINEGQQTTPNPTALDTKQHYLKLFEFLKEKTEFLLRLSEYVKDPDFKVYRRQNYEERDR